MNLRFSFRLYLLAILILGGLCLLVVRLWSVQIERHEEFKNLMPATSKLTVRVPGVRGRIRDRNGIVLASNRISYDVALNLREIYDAYRLQHEKIPITRFEVTDAKGMLGWRPEPDMAVIVNEMVIPRLNELGLAEDYNSNSLQIHWRSTKGVVPYIYRTDLSYEEFARFAEHNLELPGVTVTIRALREYIYGAMACHVLGYVKPPDIDLVSKEEQRSFDFYVADDIGVWGIEKSMNQELQGVPGIRTLLKDQKGNIRREPLSFVPPKLGADVYLTIDARIQYAAEQALRQIGRGAVVVLDPYRGDVLALVSVPSFDPNKFIPSINREDWNEYVTDKTHPMVNRALKDHAPGSTFKLPIAFAGFLNEAYRRPFYCSGGVQYGAKFMRCWIHDKGGQHGSLYLTDAIKQSCNAFFYQYGNAAGIKNIVQVGEWFGLGQRSGIGIDGEDPGILPGPQWMRLNVPGGRWSDAQTANTSIGQGYCEATPVQMAVIAATIGTGGLNYKPRLVRKVVDSDGEVIQQDEPILRCNMLEHGITKDQIDLVRSGMWKVVNEGGGTARRARIGNLGVSGKTGTAQFWRGSVKDNHAWFVCFAPFDKPKVAVCVFVQGGKAGGMVAAPIAKKIIEETLALEKGYNPKLEKLVEAKGNFDFVQLVSFDPSEATQIFSDDDAETASHVPAMRSSQAYRSTAAAPAIRQSADSKGRVKRTSRKKWNPFQKLFKKKSSGSTRTPNRWGR